MLNSIEAIRAHLRITGDENDVILYTYASAAEEYVYMYTRNEFTVDPIPAGVRAAALLLVGDMYENRLAQTSVALHENAIVERLLWPHRNFTDTAV